MNRDQFLDFVRDYVKHDPEVAAYIADNVQIGLRNALSEAKERAADMEAALAISMAKRMSGVKEAVCAKLEKWEGKTSNRWDWLTKT